MKNRWQHLGPIHPQSLPCYTEDKREDHHNGHLGRKLITLTGEAATPTSMTVEVTLANRESTPLGAGDKHGGELGIRKRGREMGG